MNVSRIFSRMYYRPIQRIRYVAPAAWLDVFTSAQITPSLLQQAPFDCEKKMGKNKIERAWFRSDCCLVLFGW